jgi:2-dehydro-3-deoxyphosphogluconate aldolase/(4S)-4-hydroxy-2-oxoglutarate aldolase
VTDKKDIIKEMLDEKIVAVVRVEDGLSALKAVEAIYKGGIRIIEITFTVPRADEVISKISEEMANDILVGAGTVIDSDLCKRALDAGAEFIVSPNVHYEVIKLASESGKVTIPGAMTPTEIVNAWQAGSDMVKLFPADLLGIPYIKALRGPLPQIPLMATGGISVDNAKAFLDSGVQVLGVGGKLVDKKAIAAGDWDQLTRNAEELINAVCH